MNRNRFYRAACIAMIAGGRAEDQQRAIDYARIALGLDDKPAEPPTFSTLDEYRAQFSDKAA